MDRTFDAAIRTFGAWQTMMEAVMNDAAPCLDCGTTGGWRPSSRNRPWRSRGVCMSCRDKRRAAGTLDEIPAARSAYASNGAGGNPYPPGTSHEYMLRHTPQGQRQDHALIPGYDARAVHDEAEAFAARWVAAHPEQRIAWQRPEFAAYGPVRDERAA